MRVIDNFLNKITMYRLVLYYLLFLLGVAEVYSVFGILPYNPLALLFSIVFLVGVCWATNTLFSKTFQAPANVESAYISALILALIITPLSGLGDLWLFFWAGVWAMASKYILAIRRQHIFNPIAFAVALTALTLNQTASWWVADVPMLPFVLLGGFLIVRKTNRSDLVLSFGGAAVVTTVLMTVVSGSDLVASLQNLVFYTPLLFFAAVIITEPLTMPPTNRLQIAYGILVGFLFSPQVHFGPVYITPEQAILAGNLAAFVISPRARLVLTLRDKIQIAPDIYDFIFTPSQKLSFAPGQYMEWTLGHERPDSRGNRRYFTLASSPTEDLLRVGVKFYEPASSFKRNLLGMPRNSEIVAAQLAGDFVLPANPKQKCVFIAGGIGITPFRSMLKYLMDTRQRRPIVLIYINRTVADIVYQDVIERAVRSLGIKVVYTLTDKTRIPPSWRGRVGYIDEKALKDEIPDYGNCIYYLSGPNSMVTSFEKILGDIGIKSSDIKKDYFPGFM